MKRISALGAKGVKIDFMQSDKQYVMQLYLDILKDAADFHLLVDFHGSTMPRGFARTYPNLMTMESVRGTEQYWDTEFAEHAHTFHTIYPFTRNVVGSMDYTPVVLSTPSNKIPRKTTDAHELALAIAFESGLQHYCDAAASYRALPGVAQQMLKDIPVAWDETKLIGGTPGELVMLARRRDKDWFLSVLNGDAKAKQVSIPLKFLTDTTYKLTLIKDGKSQKEIQDESKLVSAKDKLNISLLPRGGALAKLTPKG